MFTGDDNPILPEGNSAIVEESALTLALTRLDPLLIGPITCAWDSLPDIDQSLALSLPSFSDLEQKKPVGVTASATSRTCCVQVDACSTSGPCRLSYPAAKKPKTCEVIWEPANKLLWEEFSKAGLMEMTISKAGRRMFPPLTVKVRGISPDRTHIVKLRVVPADNWRYKYNKETCEWLRTIRVSSKDSTEYTHPNATFKGNDDKVITFKNLKLTCKASCKAKVIPDLLLETGCKYTVQIVVEEVDDIMLSYGEVVFPFPDIEFMAVSAYQNNAIGELKIKHNPYAAAFRTARSHKLAGKSQ